MTSFKTSATMHQLEYFAGKNQKDLKKQGRAQNHWLNQEAAAAGKIFYDGYDIFGYVQRDFRNNKKETPEWFYDTLRSQHIPCNFFVPLMHENKLGIKVFNDLLGLDIQEINRIEFEYPKRKDNPLEDNTSFDAFIEYSFAEGKKGFLGIEVKNTEGGYSAGEKEKKWLSCYHKHSKPELYNNPGDSELESNQFRQVWRNHLLAILFAEKKYTQFHSITIYPSGNEHFARTMTKYPINFLTEKGKMTLSGVTYEEYFKTLKKYAENEQQNIWVKYLMERYL
jgi:hypothetical protein